MSQQKKCTIFCDIDGTLFEYRAFTTYKSTVPTNIQSVVNHVNMSYDNGHHVVLTTARPEYLRCHTKKELDIGNIKYHQLVMGVARGTRILINDNEQENVNRAFSINLTRNKGLSSNDEDLLNKLLVE